MFSVVSVFDMSTAHLVGSSAGIATGYGLDGPGSNQFAFGHEGGRLCASSGVR